jgi:hypothetical protein
MPRAALRLVLLLCACNTACLPASPRLLRLDLAALFLPEAYQRFFILADDHARIGATQALKFAQPKRFYVGARSLARLSSVGLTKSDGRS